MESATLRQRFFWIMVLLLVVISMSIIIYYHVQIGQIDQQLKKMQTSVIAKLIQLSFVFILLSSIQGLHAQDISNIPETDPLKVNGVLNAGIRAYEANGIDNRNDPFVWTTSGAFNFNFYGVSLPFSFMFSSQEQNFRQPFNRFGVSPTYKWITAHFGYRNLEFSPYTMSGNTILGAGVDLTPGKFRFTAIYGRLRRQVEEDTLSTIGVIPSYKRMGYAVRAGYGTADDRFDLTLLKAHDDENSINTPLRATISPEDNLAWSMLAQKKITRGISMRVEYAMSALNRDLRTDETALPSNRTFNHLGSFFTPTISAQITDALDATLLYKLNRNITLDVLYQRVDPGYRTLGTYFFNNDREQISLNGNFQAMESKLQLRAGFGTTRNNLGSTESQTLSRKAGNINISYAFCPQINVSVNYSNFNSSINFIADPLDPLRSPEDTLNVVQIGQNAGVFMTYNKRGDNRSHALSFNANYQGQSPGNGSEQAQVASSGMVNGNLLYRLSLTSSKTQFSLNLNFNHNDFSESVYRRLGPTFGFGKSAFKNRLRFMASASYFAMYMGDQLHNITTNARFTGSWKVNKSSALNAGFSMINRKTKSASTASPSFGELISTVGYNYRF